LGVWRLPGRDRTTARGNDERHQSYAEEKIKYGAR
jgi:hypothetical protein